MTRKITSRKGLFGETNYDENGKKIGRSSPGILGGALYDRRGRRIGETTYNLFSATTRLKEK